MSSLLMVIAAAMAQPCNVPEVVAALPVDPSFERYTCLEQSDDAGALLVAALGVDDPSPRHGRALALWLLRRGDLPWDPAFVRALSAADRRFLADGVRARRGRKTPSAEHAKAFEQLDWYRPKAGYVESMLTAEDHAKIAMADKPPPAPTVEVPPMAAPAGGCSDLAARAGCGGGGAGVALVLLPLLPLRRRWR
jgi:hypothetical protein